MAFRIFYQSNSGREGKTKEERREESWRGWLEVSTSIRAVEEKSSGEMSL